MSPSAGLERAHLEVNGHPEPVWMSVAEPILLDMADALLPAGNRPSGPGDQEQLRRIPVLQEGLPTEVLLSPTHNTNFQNILSLLSLWDNFIMF